MRINTRPGVISIATGQPTRFAVSFVGHVPKPIGTQYIERVVGLCEHPDQAGQTVGAFITETCAEQAYAALAERVGAERAQAALLAGDLEVTVPDIPGVTSPGQWRNKPFGDRDAHRARHSLKARDERNPHRVSA